MIAPLALASALTTACSLAAGEPAAPTTTASSTTASTSTTSTTTTTTTTTIVVRNDLGGAEAAARALHEAWRTGNRALADQVAVPAAISTMFDVTPDDGEWLWAGCRAATAGPSSGIDWECGWRIADHSALMEVGGSEYGYKVVNVVVFPDS